MYRTLATSILVSLQVLGCARLNIEPPPAAARAAEAQSHLAATPQQAQLWKIASQDAASRGLETVPLVDRPVSVRQRVATETQVVQPQPFQFPKELIAGVRITSAPALPQGRFAGEVQVTRIESERIEVDLGDRRILSFYARAGGSPLRTVAGEKVQLDYRFNDDPFNRREILALRMANGDGVLSILESGYTPVTVQVPLFALTATQLAKAENDTADVDVRVGNERKILAQGQIADFPDSRLSVGLVASIAYTGASVARAEGNPYAIRLVAWPKR